MAPNLSLDLKKRIVHLYHRNFKNPAIKARLQSEGVSVSRHSISAVINRYKARGSVQRLQPKQPLTHRQQTLREVIIEVFEADNIANSRVVQQVYQERYGKT